MFSNKTQKLLALQNDYIERINKNAVKLDKQLNFLMEIQNHLNKQVGGSTTGTQGSTTGTEGSTTGTEGSTIPAVPVLDNVGISNTADGNLADENKEKQKKPQKRRAEATTQQGRIVGEYNGRYQTLQTQITEKGDNIDPILIQEFQDLPQPSSTNTQEELDTLKILYDKILGNKRRNQQERGEPVSPRPDSPIPEEYVDAQGEPIQQTPLPSTTVGTGATDGSAETAEAVRERRRRALRQSAQDTGAASLAVQRMQPDVKSGSTADGPSGTDRFRQAAQTVATEQAVVSAMKGTLGTNVTKFQEAQAYNELLNGLMTAQEEQNDKLATSLNGLQEAIQKMQQSSKERVTKMAAILQKSQNTAKNVSMNDLSQEQQNAIKAQLDAVTKGTATLEQAVENLFGQQA